jgi:hypothetical protein
LNLLFYNYLELFYSTLSPVLFPLKKAITRTVINRSGDSPLAH